MIFHNNVTGLIATAKGLNAFGNIKDAFERCSSCEDSKNYPQRKVLPYGVLNWRARIAWYLYDTLE